MGCPFSRTRRPTCRGCSIEDIPVELLVDIFKNLSTQDVKASSLVSRRWAQAAAPHIFRKFAITRNTGQHPDDFSSLESYPAALLVHVQELRLWTMGKGGLDIGALADLVTKYPNLHSLELYALGFNNELTVSPGQSRAALASRRLKKLGIGGLASLDDFELFLACGISHDIDTLVISSSILRMRSEDLAVTMNIAPGTLRVRSLVMEPHAGTQQQWTASLRAMRHFHRMLDHTVLEFVDDCGTGLWASSEHSHPYPGLRRLRTKWLNAMAGEKLHSLSHWYPSLERVDLGSICKCSLGANLIYTLQNAPDTLQQCTMELHLFATHSTEYSTRSMLEVQLATAFGGPAWLEVSQLIETLPNFRGAKLTLVLHTSLDPDDDDKAYIKNFARRWISSDARNEACVEFILRLETIPGF